MPVRIFVADDHEVVREGVKSLLKTHPDWVICGEAANGPDTVSGVQTTHPDALVLDLSMPGLNGLEVAREISTRLEQTRILVFTMHDSTILTREAQKAGARGLVHKSLAGRDLIRALATILEGGTFFESGDGQEAKSDKAVGTKRPLFMGSVQSIFDCISFAVMFQGFLYH
ncbi:MAG TPA: response regulator transcription factor [Terriglobales bacterium]|nr:response regulator transcription factor [Terriglobales bacterium]